MADPEGFKAGSAWMSVRPNIDEAEWRAKIAAAVEAASAGTSPQMASGLSKGLVDAKPALERSSGEIGKSIGAGITRGVSDAELPIMDEAERIGKGIGTTVSENISTETTERLRDARGRFISAGQQIGTDLADGITRDASGRLRDSRGRFVTMGQDIGAGIGDGLSKGIDPGLNETSQKVKDSAKKTGQDAGAAAGQGMSPLIIAALVGAGAVGAPLLVAGLGAALVGATALIDKQNKAISADFARTGKDAAAAVQQAAAPLSADLNAALIGVDRQVKAMGPDLKNLFAASEPDIATVTSGLTGLVSGVLPGMTSALTRGQAIVTDFSASLPVLGADVGRFFNGLVGNADMEGRALQSTLNTVGNTVYTVGTLLGSTATAASPALIGVTHVLNGLDDAVRSIGSPAAVGGALGLFGAMKLDPAISSGLQGVSNKLTDVAAKADGAGGLLGKAGTVAEKAAGGFGAMADIVGGPWGLAIGAGVGLLSGLIGQLGQADDATKAITVSEGQLADAVAADMGKVGQSTSAFIAAQAQTSGLADEAKNAGVSLDLLTEAATGNKAAMGQLTAVTSATNDVQRQQQLTAVASLSGQQQLTDVQQRNAVAVNSLYSSTVQLASGQQQLNTQFATGSVRLAQGMVASNTLTTANQQLLNSVRAQTQQVADAINKQTALDAATAALSNTTNIFNATLDAAHEKLVAKAQTTADNTVAALNLGDGQSVLNQALAGAVQQFDQATSSGNGYDTVLKSLSGSTNDLLSSEAGFTTALSGVDTAIAANGRSLDVNNDKGAKNIQVFTGIATSADKAATALYQSEVSTKGASKAYDDANAKLASERDAFVAAADKAGFNKTQVKALADELFKLPQNIPINVNANTGSARQQLAHLINDINNSTGTVQVYASTVNLPGGKVDLTGGGKALGAGGKAGGGPVTAGSMVPVGEHGQETALFGQDAYILTHGQTVAMQSRPAGQSATPVINQYFYGSALPTQEQNADMMRQLAAALT